MMDTAVCRHCGQQIVKHGAFFWILPEEDPRRATYCPDVNNGLHDPEDDDA